MRRHRLDRRLLTALAVAAAAAVALTPAIKSAAGASTNHQIFSFSVREDRFDAFDFLTESANRNNVDWAVDVIFGHDANINKVKSAMNHGCGLSVCSHVGYTVGYGYGLFESKMHALFDNGNGWEWDRDGGMKTFPCGFPDVFHYRIYAPYPADRFYNQNWGYYVVGTTHVDHKECTGEGPDKWSGRSEYAEGFLDYEAQYFFGNNHVAYDQVNIGNGENRQEAGHWWENDGRASYISVY